MIRHYCDWCGKEIKRNYVTHRLRNRLYRYDNARFKNEQIQAEVLVGVNGAWNSGDLCRECLILVLTTGDESAE